MNIGKEVGKSIEVRKLQPGIPVKDWPERKPEETPILAPNWPVRTPVPAPAVSR